MALARKCDICGKYYEEYNVNYDAKNVNGFMFLNICSSGAGKLWKHNPIDCCPECMESIKKHVDSLMSDTKEGDSIYD